MHEENISFFLFLRKVWNFYVTMIADFFMLSFNYFLLKFKHNPNLVASFGFGCSYLYFSMSFLYGFSEYLGIFLAHTLGAKLYNKSTIMVFKVLLLQALCAIISIILIILAP